MVLVATTLVTNRDVPVVIPAGVLELRLLQGRLRLALVKMRMHHLHDGPTPGRCRLDFDNGHYADSPEKFSSCPAFKETYAFLT